MKSIDGDEHSCPENKCRHATRGHRPNPNSDHGPNPNPNHSPNRNPNHSPIPNRSPNPNPKPNHSSNPSHSPNPNPNPNPRNNSACGDVCVYDFDEQAAALASWLAAYGPSVPILQSEGTVPRISLRELYDGTFHKLIQKHSYVVVRAEAHAISSLYISMEHQLMRFFEGDDQWKQSKAGFVYCNERGVPMWNVGYEKCDTRELFRVHCARAEEHPWPSPTFEQSWTALLKCLRRLCDRALCTITGKDGIADHTRDEDFSVMYAMRYDNSGHTQDVHAASDYNVTAHVDPSLFVAEPCANAPGLEVLDTHTNRWVCVEEVCAHACDVILFCGRALENFTCGEFKATQHRVRKTNKPRVCVIYEQKYSMYY